jgi:transposase
MGRYKPVHRDPLLLPVVLAEQVQPGTFEFALDHLVDHELDVSALDARFRNDETGASAYDPRVMLKIVLLAYSRGLITSRRIEQACRQNVVFIAVSGDSQPSYSHIAKFVRELGDQVQPLFTQVLIKCDRQGLIGRQMFAIDGVKLPSNASKERSGTHAELRHRADRLDKAARKMIELHRSRDDSADNLMKDAIDSARGRSIYSQRIATVEPVFANLRHNKRLDGFTVRGKENVGTSGVSTACSTTSRSSRGTATAPNRNKGGTIQGLSVRFRLAE